MGCSIEDTGQIIIRIAVQQSVATEHLKIALVHIRQSFSFIDERVNRKHHIEIFGDLSGFFAFPKTGGMPY